MIDKTVKVIESAASFQQWYRDTPGVNDSVRATLELAAAGGNLFQYSSSDGQTVQDDIHDACAVNGGTAGTLSSGFFPLEDIGTKLCNIWPYWILGTNDECCAGPDCPVASQWDPTIEYGNCTAGGDRKSVV